MYVCASYACSAADGQKRESNPLEQEWEKVVSLSCGCWEPHPSALEMQLGMSTQKVRQSLRKRRQEKQVQKTFQTHSSTYQIIMAFIFVEFPQQCFMRLGFSNKGSFSYNSEDLKDSRNMCRGLVSPEDLSLGCSSLGVPNHSFFQKHHTLIRSGLT